MSFGSVVPYSSAASATSGLIVEPGGYTPRSARSYSGLSMSFCSAAYSLTVSPRAKPFGSNVGVLTNAITSPLFGIDGDDGGALARERLLGGTLHAHVEREDQVVARHRLLPLQLGGRQTDALDQPALRVDEQLLVTGVAVQLFLVGALDAELADQRRAGVLRHIDARLVLLADRAHVAERVHGAAACPGRSA